MRNIALKTVAAVAPQSLSGTTATSDAGFEREYAEWGRVICQLGAPTGSPSAVSVAFKLQDSSDNSTYADVDGATATMTAKGVAVIDFTNANCAKYLKVVATPAFTGGTSPTVPASASVTYGGNYDSE